MYENLIRKWLRMIPWVNFWEPKTKGQICIKWSVILLVLILSFSVFCFNLDKIQAYEYALQNPVILEAEKEVVSTMSATGYDIYVSYSYDGFEYDHIYYGRYSTDKGDSDIIYSRKDPMVIAVDPANPGVPIKFMFQEFPVLLAVVLWSLGLASLIYGTALEFPKFRQWRVTCANRPGFFSRPYGKPEKTTEHPDYVKDTVFIWLPIYFVHAIVLGFTFPNTFF